MWQIPSGVCTAVATHETLTCIELEFLPVICQYLQLVGFLLWINHVHGPLKEGWTIWNGDFSVEIIFERRQVECDQSCYDQEDN